VLVLVFFVIDDGFLGQQRRLRVLLRCTMRHFASRSLSLVLGYVLSQLLVTWIDSKPLSMLINPIGKRLHQASNCNRSFKPRYKKGDAWY